MPDQTDDLLSGFSDALIEHGVPSHNHSGLMNWIEHGWEPGSFLMSLLRNDLKMAVLQADSVNTHFLVPIVRVMYNHAPAPCWGSPEECDVWRKSGGLRGL